MAVAYASPLFEQLDTLNVAYSNSIRPKNVVCYGSANATAKAAAIKTPLYPHQESLVEAMLAHQQRMTAGFVWRGQIVSGKLGILADPPGTGKTLSVLSYIGQILDAPLRPTNELVGHSNRFFYSHTTAATQGTAHHTNLIIVPHTLYDQWVDEIAKRTTLKPFKAETRRALRTATAAEAMRAADFVLTTAACYKHVAEFAAEANIRWNQVFIDEASTIYFSANEVPLEFQFLWLISSTWIPFLFKNRLSSASSLLYIKDRIPDLNADLAAWLGNAQDDALQFQSNIAASAYFKNYLPYNHNARGLLVIRTADAALPTLPPATVERVKCLSFLHGSAAAMIRSHITKVDAPTLLTALTVPHRELGDLIRDMPYRGAVLREKAADDCAICLDAPDHRVAVSCCGSAYCGKCILRHMTTANTCPTCRGAIGITDLTWIKEPAAAGAAAPVAQPLSSRLDYCVSLAKDASNSLIIYTMYDNIYYQLADRLSGQGILVEKLDSNPYVVSRIGQTFEKRQLRVVCVSSIDTLRGLNLGAATHIIFYHALPFYELRQILLGSAQRLGRQSPLRVVQLESEFDL